MSLTNLYPISETIIKTKNPELLLVHFTANWCVFCNLMKPVMTQIIKKYQIEAKIVDTDENMSLAEEYGVYKIPCTLIMRNEKVVESITGLLYHDQLDNIIKKYIIQ